MTQQMCSKHGMAMQEGKYGPYCKACWQEKKDGQRATVPAAGGRPGADPKAMILSYAKDIYCAKLAHGDKVDGGEMLKIADALMAWYEKRGAV